MKEKNEKKILIVSEQESYGNLLNSLFMSQGFTTEYKRHLSELASSQIKPVAMIYNEPFIEAGNPNLCKSICRAETFTDIPRIYLSSTLDNCKECEHRKPSECTPVKKPFQSSELVSKVKEFTA